MRNKILSWFGLSIILTVAFCFIPTTTYGFYYENPAEEAFTTTHFELLIPQLNLGAKNNLFNLNNLNIDLTDPDVKDKFLNQMGGGIFKTDFNSQLKAGLTIGRFSLHLRPWATGSLRLAPAIPELIFIGYGPADNETSRTYQLAGTKANGLAALSLDVKYGHPIDLDRESELGIGVTLRYVKGIAMADSEVTSGLLTVDKTGNPTINMEGCYTMVAPSGSENDDFTIGDFFKELPGNGFLVDIGASYSRDRWRAGLALQNIGAISWKEVEKGSYSYNGAVTTGPDGPELNKEDFNDEVTVLSSYTMTLPLVLQVQGSYRFLGPLYCHLGAETGLSDGWGVSSSPRLWTGLEWKPRHLIRMAGGVSYHDRHFNYNALLELHLLCFWANLKLDWMHDFGGLNASAMFALHF